MKVSCNKEKSKAAGNTKKNNSKKMSKEKEFMKFKNFFFKYTSLTLYIPFLKNQKRVKFF